MQALPHTHNMPLTDDKTVASAEALFTSDIASLRTVLASTLDRLRLTIASPTTDIGFDIDIDIEAGSVTRDSLAAILDEFAIDILASAWMTEHEDTISEQVRSRAEIDD